MISVKSCLYQSDGPFIFMFQLNFFVSRPEGEAVAQEQMWQLQELTSSLVGSVRRLQQRCHTFQRELIMSRQAPENEILSLENRMNQRFGQQLSSMETHLLNLISNPSDQEDIIGRILSIEETSSRALYELKAELDEVRVLSHGTATNVEQLHSILGRINMQVDGNLRELAYRTQELEAQGIRALDSMSSTVCLFRQQMNVKIQQHLKVILPWDALEVLRASPSVSIQVQRISGEVLYLRQANNLMAGTLVELKSSTDDARQALTCAQLCRGLVVDNNRDIRVQIEQFQQSCRRNISLALQRGKNTNTRQTPQPLRNHENKLEHPMDTDQLVTPIPNQENLCFLIAPLHLLLRDKSLTRTGSLGPRFNDVLVVTRALDRLNNGSTDISAIFSAVNTARMAVGSTSWKPGEQGCDFQALQFLLQRFAQARCTPHRQYLAEMAQDCACGVKRKQYHHLIVKVDCPPCNIATTLGDVISSYVLRENCRTCLQVASLRLICLPRQVFVNLTVTSQLRLTEISRVHLNEFETLMGKRFRIKGVTQYNLRLRHFRTIRQLYSEGSFRWFLMDSQATPLRGRFPVEMNPEVSTGWTNSIVLLELSNEPPPKSSLPLNKPNSTFVSQGTARVGSSSGKSRAKRRNRSRSVLSQAGSTIGRRNRQNSSNKQDVSQLPKFQEVDANASIQGRDRSPTLLQSVKDPSQREKPNGMRTRAKSIGLSGLEPLPFVKNGGSSAVNGRVNEKYRKSNSTKFRIGTWNCGRGLNDMEDGHCYLKKQLLRSYHCLALGITQPQKSFRLKGYRCYHGVPHQAKQSKLNVSIGVMEQTSSELRKSEVNYVSVICSGQPWLRPTLLACVYLHPSHQARELNDLIIKSVVKDITQWKQISYGDYILMGDYNLTHEGLLNRHVSMYPFISTANYSTCNYSTCTRTPDDVPRQIDRIYSSWPINDIRLQIDMEGPENGIKLSDHLPVIVQLTGMKNTHRVYVPNRKYARGMTAHIIKSMTPISLSEAYSSYRPRKKKYKSCATRTPWELAPDLVTLQAIAQGRLLNDRKVGFRGFINQLSRDRFSSQVGSCFRKLRLATNYHAYEKRDGGLLTTAVHHGVNIQGVQLEEAVLEHFQNIHNAVPGEPSLSFPVLCASPQLIRVMARNVTKGKAITFDGIDDSLFDFAKGCICETLTTTDARGQRQTRSDLQGSVLLPSVCRACTRRIHALGQLLGREYWSKTESQRHFKCRLICLNKKHPNIPAIQQYRPLVVSSPVVKFMEGWLMPHLRAYGKKRLHRDQHAFVAHSSVDLCKRRLFTTTLQRREDGLHTIAVFVDLSSAYDRVDRRLLFNLLRQRNVLPPEGLQLLAFLLGRIRIQYGKNNCFCSNGVPQGLTTSPILFDVYTEPLLEILRARGNLPDVMMFADDLLILASGWEQAKSVIQDVETWAAASNMIVNKAKSGIMIMDGPLPPHGDTRGYPLVDNYRYLGCAITPSLLLTDQVKSIGGKIFYLRGQLAPVLRGGKTRFNASLFRTLAFPLYRLAFPLYDLAGRSDQESFRIAIRKQARAFLGVPQNCPNRIIEGILGDLGPMALDVCKACDSLLGSRNQFKQPDKMLLMSLTEHPRINLLPDSLIPALRLTYGRICTEHQVPLRVSHLRQQHGLVYGLDTALTLYQTSSQRSAARSIISKLIKTAVAMTQRHPQNC